MYLFANATIYIGLAVAIYSLLISHWGLARKIKSSLTVVKVD